MTRPRAFLPAERAHWFHAARDRLSMVWSVMSLLLAALWVIANRPEIPLMTQLWVVALGVGLFGVLHGGLDHLVGERVFRRQFKRVWSAYFSLGYVGLAITVMVAWWLVAPLMLLLFLAASMLHFGLRDEHRSQRARNGFVQLASVCGLGAAPIIIPWLMFPQEVSLLFGWLAGTSATAWQPALSMTGVFGVMSWIVLPIAMITALIYLKWQRCSDTFAWFEFLATIALFAMLPPLLAFAWYFCFLHSLRHLLTLAERLAPPQTWAALGWVGVRGLPLTILTLLASGAAYAWLRHVDLNAAEAVTRVIFWGLAALTFPHMALTWLWERKERKGPKNGSAH